eukprot:CAMPEP_0113879092 /NCGR_PEP_ID=MMETSP0780_2-20120614/7042_1 /TAXON_ID=652834 /ORGANISM="Palpitomonas bilix" /LENGTH=469 /DNA_ID=CAMNT_0000865627 /DNA_START=75 /DNA_END=1486 /DNA_ORIENTATION=- /assembly_acc=CAM_ASM_000599
MTEGKTHVSIVICGHVDSGKSTTTGHLLFDLGGIPERELEKLKQEAASLGKSSFAFAFYMDRQKEERERGVTIACTTKEFFTDNTTTPSSMPPGHRDFIKNMISGASQADVALLMVPADGNFITAIQPANHKEGVVQGQTRQHARLLNLLGTKQVIVGVNKMDVAIGGAYSQARYTEVANEMKNMLMKVGWKKWFETNQIPIIPISGWMGDNLIKKGDSKGQDNMPWWKGTTVKLPDGKTEIQVNCLLDALNDMVTLPPPPLEKPLRMPVSGVFKIKGVGDVITGRVEQGQVKPNDEVVFLPTHTTSNACAGKVFTVEMHHKSVASAGPGDNVGLNVKNLDKQNMPRTGDIMILKKDETIKAVKSFTAQCQVLDHPGELKPGYTPIAFVRTSRAAVRMSAINWKMGKSTGGQKMPDAPFVKANEAAEVVFEPKAPFVVDTFKNCEGLGRVAILEGNTVVMLGKVTKVEF